MVVLIEAESRKALLEMLVASGRDLSDELRVSVNYTTTKSRNPDFEIASMNCAIGEIILENYKRDQIGQELQGELKVLTDKLTIKQRQVELFDRTLRGLSAYRPPNAPSPPEKPPLPSTPPGLLAPPTPPRAVAFDIRLQEMRQEQSSLEKAVEDKLSEIGGPCIKSATNFCGRTYEAAPNPWISADGTPCAGYTTEEAVEGSFCAHWGSPVRCYSNPNTPTLHTT